jgi:hypothetical protein
VSFRYRILYRRGEQHLRTRGAVRLTAIVVGRGPAAIGFWHAVGYAGQRDRVPFIRMNCVDGGSHSLG